MISRRLFLGTAAGAAGLFGFFGRLRFQAPVFFAKHNNPKSPFRDIEFTYGEDRVLYAFYGDERMVDMSGEGDWQYFEILTKGDDGLAVHACMKARLINDDEAEIDYLAFSKRTGKGEWGNLAYVDARPQIAPFKPIDFLNYKPESGWNALA